MSLLLSNGGELETRVVMEIKSFHCNLYHTVVEGDIRLTLNLIQFLVYRYPALHDMQVAFQGKITAKEGA